PDFVQDLAAALIGIRSDDLDGYLSDDLAQRNLIGGEHAAIRAMANKLAQTVAAVDHRAKPAVGMCHGRKPKRDPGRKPRDGSPWGLWSEFIFIQRTDGSQAVREGSTDSNCGVTKDFF